MNAEYGVLFAFLGFMALFCIYACIRICCCQRNNQEQNTNDGGYCSFYSPISRDTTYVKDPRHFTP